jgi:hypothetical protein
VGEPECNGASDLFMRMLKEQCLYLHRFQRLAEARRIIGEFISAPAPSGSSSDSAIKRRWRHAWPRSRRDTLDA